MYSFDDSPHDRSSLRYKVTVRLSKESVAFLAQVRKDHPYCSRSQLVETAIRHWELASKSIHVTPN